MAKNTTPSFVVTRRIMTDDRGYDKLNKIMRITERMYNAGVRHCIRQLNELKKDVWYQYCLGQFFACKDEKESKRWGKEIFICAAAYQLTEYDLHTYFGRGKISGYEGGIGINIVQKTATVLYSAVKKAIFGKKIHFRKFEREDRKRIEEVVDRFADFSAADLTILTQNQAPWNEAFGRKEKVIRCEDILEYFS